MLFTRLWPSRPDFWWPDAPPERPQRYCEEYQQIGYRTRHTRLCYTSFSKHHVNSLIHAQKSTHTSIPVWNAAETSLYDRLGSPFSTQSRIEASSWCLPAFRSLMRARTYANVPFPVVRRLSQMSRVCHKNNVRSQAWLNEIGSHHVSSGASPTPSKSKNSPCTLLDNAVFCHRPGMRGHKMFVFQVQRNPSHR